MEDWETLAVYITAKLNVPPVPGHTDTPRCSTCQPELSRDWGLLLTDSLFLSDKFSASFDKCQLAQVLTKAWSAALLNALGDILAQKVVDKNEQLDLKRLGIFTFLVTTPASSSSASYCTGMPSSHNSAACGEAAADGSLGCLLLRS